MKNRLTLNTYYFILFSKKFWTIEKGIFKSNIFFATFIVTSHFSPSSFLAVPLPYCSLHLLILPFKTKITIIKQNLYKRCSALLEHSPGSLEKPLLCYVDSSSSTVYTQGYKYITCRVIVSRFSLNKGF